MLVIHLLRKTHKSWGELSERGNGEVKGRKREEREERAWRIESKLAVASPPNSTAVRSVLPLSTLHTSSFFHSSPFKRKLIRKSALSKSSHIAFDNPYFAELIRRWNRPEYCKHEGTALSFVTALLDDIALAVIDLDSPSRSIKMW